MRKLKEIKRVLEEKNVQRKRRKELYKNPNVQQVLNFREIQDGYIRTLDNEIYYFLAEYPKNERLMTVREKKVQRNQLALLYNNFSHITRFSTDLPYSLQDNKMNLEACKTGDEERNDLLNRMNGTLDVLEDNSENSIKRFYYVFKDSQCDIDIVKAHFEDNNIKYFIPNKKELEQMLRSYILLDDNVHDVLYFGFDEYIDTFLPAQIKVLDDMLYIGGKYRKVIFAKNYPNPINEFYLARLSKYKGVNVTIKAIEKKSNDMVDQIVKSKTKNTMLRQEGSIKNKIIASYEDRKTEGLYDYMADTQQKMFDVSLYIEITGKTKEEIKRKEEKVQTALKSITTQTISNNSMNLYKSVSPLHDRPLKYIKRNMPSQSLACLNNGSMSIK